MNGYKGNLLVSVLLVLLAAVSSQIITSQRSLPPQPRPGVPSGSPTSQNPPPVNSKKRKSASQTSLPRATFDKARASELFNNHCSPCHESRQGDFPHARAALDPTPTNLNSQAFVFGDSDDDIFDTIKFGVDGTGMPPAQGRLSDDEIWQTTYWVQSLRQKRPREKKS